MKGVIVVCHRMDVVDDAVRDDATGVRINLRIAIFVVLNIVKLVRVRVDVTTTDELIPSGETSSFRSNPLKLAEFALSRKDPKYVSRAKEVKNGKFPEGLGIDEKNTTYGSVVCAVRPGDGSAREQAASCQRVLGGVANIAVDYATKRYRSNLINWGMIPFVCAKNDFKVGEYVYIQGVRAAIESGKDTFTARVLGNDEREVLLKVGALTSAERQIILKGCLINFYKD